MGLRSSPLLGFGQNPTPCTQGLAAEEGESSSARDGCAACFRCLTSAISHRSNSLLLSHPCHCLIRRLHPNSQGKWVNLHQPGAVIGSPIPRLKGPRDIHPTRCVRIVPNAASFNELPRSVSSASKAPGSSQASSDKQLQMSKISSSGSATSSHQCKGAKGGWPLGRTGQVHSPRSVFEGNPAGTCRYTKLIVARLLLHSAKGFHFGLLCVCFRPWTRGRGIFSLSGETKESVALRRPCLHKRTPRCSASFEPTRCARSAHRSSHLVAKDSTNRRVRGRRRPKEAEGGRRRPKQ